MTSQPPADLSAIEAVLEHYRGGSRADLLPALHDVQAELGWLPGWAMEAIGQTLRVPLADIHGVVEFYSMFYNRPVGKRIVRVCTDPSCAVRGSEEVLRTACQQAGVVEGGNSPDGSLTVERMTCLGLCDQAPAALVDDLPVTNLKASEVAALFDAEAPTSELRVTGELRYLTGRIGEIDPLDLAAHRKVGRFTALAKAIDMGPEAVIEQVKASNLVGRGGAAFPTGMKWQFTRGAQGSPKYIVCNADESEPGTFKDRVMMEGDPYQLIEGIAIAGYAIGAHQGYIFVRGEYPQAARTLQAAIDRCREAGLLGEDMLGSSYRFDITIRRGAGAYICGEETALFEAIEGKRGFPRLKPPFPTTHGLFGQPTAINNVETLSHVPDIVLNGGEWFNRWGTKDSAGFKLYCISGHVKQPGVVEAPFGVTLNQLVNDYCGGFDGEPQAVLMGGAAGVFLTPEHFDTPLTYENLRPLDASIGSGAIMIFNTETDMRQVLAQLGHFFAHESCGKCYPCQLGTQRQMEILHRVAEGHVEPDDKDRLIFIGETMTDASICGLGQTAGMAVLSALKLWPELVVPGGQK